MTVQACLPALLCPGFRSVVTATQDARPAAKPAGVKVPASHDPRVDDGRDYIGQSLLQTGHVAGLDCMMPGNPVKEAKAATGGRILLRWSNPNHHP